MLRFVPPACCIVHEMLQLSLRTCEPRRITDKLGILCLEGQINAALRYPSHVALSVVSYHVDATLWHHALQWASLDCDDDRNIDVNS